MIVRGREFGSVLGGRQSTRPITGELVGLVEHRDHGPCAVVADRRDGRLCTLPLHGGVYDVAVAGYDD